jgi:branched-chain amino acid transport system permease protein
MSDLLQHVIDALSLGGLYALAALGVALIFGVMGLINFAQGAYVMIGVYVLVALASTSVVLAIVAALGAVVVLALGTERIAFRPVRSADPTTLLVTSFAVSYFLQSGIVFSLDSRPRSADFLSGLIEPISFLGARVSALDLVTIGVTVVLVAALSLFLTRTRHGLELRAAAEDFSMARILGINANRVIALAFGVSGLLAGVVSVLYLAQTGQATPGLGLQLVLMAFLATVIGGLGSTVGAAVGGLILGALTIALQVALPDTLTAYTQAFLFAGVILLLLIRPQGLFGVASTDRV